MQNRSAIYRLIAANFISGIAQGMSMLAVPIYFAETGQSAWFGFAYMLMTIVTLFWGPYAGTLVDRYDRRKIFLLLTLINGSILGVVAVSAWYVGIGPWLVATAFATTFWNYSLHYPSFYAFLQEVSEREHYSRIASLIEVQGQLATAAAGACTGLLLKGFAWGTWVVAPVDLHIIFAFDALTYFVAFALIYSMRYQPILIRRPDVGSVIRRFQRGFSYLVKRPSIFLFGCLSYAVFISIMVHIINLSPVYVHQHLGQEGSIFAISEMFFALGAIVSGLFAQRLLRYMHPVLGIVFFTAAAGFWYLIMSANSSVPIFYSLSFALGTANAGVRVLRVSYLMSFLPNEVWGRVTSIFGTFNTLLRAAFLALFSIPFFHKEGNIIYSYYIFAAFFLVIVLTLLLAYRQIRKEAEGGAADLREGES